MAKGKKAKKQYPKIPKKKQAAVGRSIDKEYHAHPTWTRAHKIAAGIGIALRR